MDNATYQKWLKVKTNLELAGKTNCIYYKLACEALAKKNSSKD